METIIKKAPWFWLFLILALALAIRLFRITDFPAGFNLDEISQGYSAYSLLKTGRDEWGIRWPLSPRAFGDFRAPLYTYLTIPSIALLGLNKLAVRLPAAIFGGLAVLATYLLAKELFAGEKTGAEKISLLAALFLAISPWHISLSRGAFEASLTVFLMPLGIWLFLKGKKSALGYPLAALVLGINLFSYYGPKLVTLVMVFLLLIWQGKSAFKKKSLWLFLIIFAIFVGLSLQSLLAGGKTRVMDTAAGVSAKEWEALSRRQYEAVFYGLPAEVERVFNNKITFFYNRFYKNYLSYFSPEFLFTKGASEATYGMIPGRGLFYLIELPFMVLALIRLVKFRDGSLLLLLILVSPLAASLSQSEGAANRASTMMPFMQILSAFGALLAFDFLKKKILKLLLLVSFFSIFLICFVTFLEDYFYHAPMANAPFMAYGWEELQPYLLTKRKEFDKIIVSDKFSEPQIALAYYLKLDPLLVQKESKDWLRYEKEGYHFVDQLTRYNLENFEFRNFSFLDDLALKKTLFIGKVEDFAGVSGKVENIIYYPGPEKKIAFMLVSFPQSKAD